MNQTFFMHDHSHFLRSIIGFISIPALFVVQRTRVRFMIFILSFFLSGVLYGQTTFLKQFAFADDSYGYHAIELSSGGYLISGAVWDIQNYEGTLCLIRTDFYGDTLWTKFYDLDFFSGARAHLLELANGDFMVGRAGDENGMTFQLMRFTPQGNLVWSNAYMTNGGAKPIHMELVENPDGSVTVVGGVNEFVIAQVNATGGLLWTTTYELNGASNGVLGAPNSGITRTSDGGFVFVSGGSVSQGVKGAVGKVDGSGNELWLKILNKGAPFRCYQVCETSDGNLLVMAHTYSGFGGLGAENVVLIKMNQTGDVLWTRAIGSSGAESALRMQQLANGDLLFSGYLGCSSGCPRNGWLLKTDAEGEVKWSYKLPGNTLFHSAQETSDGGILLTGEMRDSLYGMSKIALIKADSLGWFCDAEPHSVQTIVTNILESQGYTIYQGGVEVVVSDSLPYKNPALIEVCPVVSVKDQEMTSHVHVFPNPTNQFLTIQYDGAPGTIRIRDNMGRIVAIYPETTPGSTISLEALDNGIYFLEVASEQFLRIVKSD